MGLAKWLIKNGPGSPGQTTKVWAKQVIKYPASMDKCEIYKQIISSFHYGQASVGSLQQQTEVSEILKFSNDCLPSLMLALMCDLKNFAKNTTYSTENFNLVTDVIYETVKDIAPDFISKSLSEFKRDSAWYLKGLQIKGFC